MNPSGPDIRGMHSGSGRAFVKLHHLFSLLEEPKERRDAANVQNVGPNAHDVIQNPRQFTKHY